MDYILSVHGNVPLRSHCGAYDALQVRPWASDMELILNFSKVEDMF